MDKGKASLIGKRAGKNKGHALPFDMIPLGQKTTEISKAKLLAAASSKPEILTSANLPVKRLQHSVSTSDRSLIKYDDVAIDCPPAELYDKVLAADQSDTSDRLLCGALKHLRAHRAKPNQHIVMTLMLLVKQQPSLFTSLIVTGSLCSLLKRDAAVNFKAKGNALVTVLACNLLYAAYAEEEHWPQQFVEVYIDDSLGERMWVDRADCKPFTDNIITAFNTKMGAKNPTMLESLTYSLPGANTGGSSASPSHSPFYHTSSTADTGDEMSAGSGLGLTSARVTPRYMFQLDSIEQLVMDIITEQMAKKQHVEVANRQLLKLLTAVSGYCAVRLLVVTKLEIWLQNPKLMRVAQDLLLSVCLNCSGRNPNDKDVIVGVLKIRVKNKQLISYYLACIRELLGSDSDNLRIAMTHTIYNELSSARNQNNLQILSIMFQQDSDRTPKLLADIFLDLLMSKDDYLKSLRALLREIVRALRQDFTFHPFCVGLLADLTNHSQFLGLELHVKERVLVSITDLVSVCELLTISPAVREASASAITWGDKRKDIAVMQTFWTQMAKIQKDAVDWLHESFITMLPNVEQQTSIQYLHKLLMMAPSDHYCKVDNWPAETDRALMLRLGSETPVLEDTLVRILMMGMESEYPLKASDALDVMELMVNRAAALNTNILFMPYPALVVNNQELVQLLLNVSVYYHPDNIMLPAHYTPPHLAISSMYWKSWTIMLVLTAYNPSTVGKQVWKKYPTLEMLMEMVMTNTYTFPPVTSGDELERINAQERQIKELERQEILEFEGHLARASSSVPITEENSLLLSELLSMNITGPARRMPAKLLADLKVLNSTLHLGHLLSKSRNPDFLFQVIQKQGTSNAMPWLAELVESSEGSLDVLPIPCLCEFLLAATEENKADDSKGKHTQKIMRYDRLLQRLQTIIQQTDSVDGERDAVEVIKYFFERLYSSCSSTRNLAIKAMKAMFVDPVTQQAMDIDIDTHVDEYEWLLVNISDIKLFAVVEKLIQESLHKALFVEMRGDVVTAYITYLLESKLYRKEPSQTMLVISQMLCTRPSLCKLLLSNKDSASMLLSAYKHFMDDAIKRTSAFEWADQSQSVMVQWANQQVVLLDMRIIHAMFEMMSKKDCTESSCGQSLLMMWFPSANEVPAACMASTSEPADIFTDNLRKTMLQSGVAQLVSAALNEVKLPQLLIFFQLFGLPIISVNSILTLLDDMYTAEPKAMKKAVQSQKQYLSRLLDTQRLRGAVGGRGLATALGRTDENPMEAEPVQQPMEVEKSSEVTTAGRLVPLMGRDTDQFVAETLCNRELCCDGLMTAQRSLVSDPSLVLKLSHSLLTAMSQSKKSLLDSFTSAPLQAAALLRLLATNEQQVSQPTRQLFELLHSEPSLPAAVRSAMDSICRKLDISTHSSLDVENQFNQQMINMCLANQHQQAVQACVERAELVQTGKDGKVSLGLIIDWLELVDPEIDSLCTSLQDKLLFGKEAVSGEGAKANVAGPAYLRSLLTHQARWTTIRQTIDRLLAAPHVQQWNSTTVLDFLTICTSHPRLYQGREQKKPRKEAMENVLCLSGEQTEKVAELICKETMQAPDSQGESQVPPAHRVNLLLNCCVDESVLKYLVESLESKSTRLSTDSVCYRRLLLMLYAQQPKLIHWLGDCNLFFQDISLALRTPCSLDPEIHAALTALGNVKAGKKYIVSSTDANLVCRKLASHHPILFLRHVSLLSCVLSGRAQFTFGEFLHRNYLVLHTNVLGLVEILQPHIFVHEDFPSIIDAYFTVIKVHGRENDDTLTALINKLTVILANFLSCLPDMCVRTIGEYKTLISALQATPKYSKNQSLKALAAANYMPAAQEPVNTPDLLSTPTVLPSTPENITNDHLKQTLRKLGKDSTTHDILSALNDLDNTSKKVVEVLGKCLDEFKRLIFSLSHEVRDLTYKLVRRYARHNPRVAGHFLSPVVACLHHDNSDVSKAALSHVAELALLMSDDDRRVLLDNSFSVAALSNSDQAIKNIKDIVKVVSTNAFT